MGNVMHASRPVTHVLPPRRRARWAPAMLSTEVDASSR
jgi:hypothetical protein